MGIDGRYVKTFSFHFRHIFENWRKCRNPGRGPWAREWRANQSRLALAPAAPGNGDGEGGPAAADGGQRKAVVVMFCVLLCFFGLLGPFLGMLWDQTSMLFGEERPARFG